MAAEPTQRSGNLKLPRGEREAEFNRVLAFSDGVFAIAITLLVLQLEVPDNSGDIGGQLADQLPDLFAFALSFAVLGRIWWSFHHRLFSGLARFDGPLIALNFTYLALVTLVPFTSDLLGDHGDDEIAVVVYAANLGILSLVGGVMIQVAFSRGLMLPELEEHARDYTGAGNWVIPAVFLASIPIAFVNPTAATFTWLLTIGVGPRVARWVESRRMRSG